MINEVHFNKNYSGTYSLSADMGGIMDMAKSFDPSMDEVEGGDMIDEAISQEEREEMIKKINQIDGISNTSFEVGDKTSLEFQFDFEDIESLNSAFSEFESLFNEDNDMVEGGMPGMESMALPIFTKKGKVISYSASFPEDQIPEGALDELDALGGSDGMMDMVMDIMDYTIVFSFDRKIKSVEIDGVDLISQDKHVVKTRIDLGKMMNGGAYKISVTTK